MRRISEALVCCALFLAVWFPPALAGETEVMVIIDSSRSMWGQVHKKAKYVMVHDAITQALENDERLLPKLGLVTYGATSPSSCQDISVVHPPNTADRETFLKSVQKTKPWGLTPVAGALAHAAAQFSGPAAHSRILLVADGVENCSGDPCAVARELKGRLPNLVVDVIALRVAEEDQSRLSCIATETGGTFLTAEDQKSLDEAAATAVNLIAEAKRPAGDETPVATNTDETAPKMEWVLNPPLPRPHPHAHLRKLAQAEAKPKTETSPAVEEVAGEKKAAETPPASTKPLETEKTAEVKTPAPSMEPATASPPDAASQPDPLVTASIPKDEAKTQTVDPDALSGKRVARATEEAPAHTRRMPDAKPEFTVNEQAAPKNQGLKLRAKLTADMRMISKPIDWTVYRVEDTQQALWKQVAAMRAPEPTFKLDPGSYLVRARYGYVAASKMVSVGEGKLTDATFVLNAGGLRILSHLVFVDTPNGTAATHFVYAGKPDINGMRTLIAKSQTQGEIIRLNAGQYRVISRLGEANSVVSTDVEVSPGVLTAVEINHKAAVLSLELANAASTANADATNLVVFDEKGRLVLRTRGTTATVILAPGHYAISGELDGRKATIETDLRIGEEKTLKLALK